MLGASPNGLLRDCSGRLPGRTRPKSLGRTSGVALRVAKEEDLSAHSDLRIPAESTIGASPLPFSDGLSKLGFSASPPTPAPSGAVETLCRSSDSAEPSSSVRTSVAVPPFERGRPARKQSGEQPFPGGITVRLYRRALGSPGLAAHRSVARRPRLGKRDLPCGGAVHERLRWPRAAGGRKVGRACNRWFSAGSRASLRTNARRCASFRDLLQ
jgi:hypothetical protein